MYNTIYEISDKPICKGRSTLERLPEWFFQTVANSAADMEPQERAASMESLEHRFGELCTRKDDRLTFLPDFKRAYFREGFRFFRTAAAALAETEYDVFAGVAPSAAFELALQGIAESYADRFGAYVYDPGSGELSALDNWLRSVDETKPYYLGGTVSYHA